MQFIPLDEITSQSKYQVSKFFHVLGFVDGASYSNDRRHLFCHEPMLVLPEADENAQLALSALVQAMQERQCGAVVRYSRANSRSKVVIGILFPLPGSNSIPDHAIFYPLPFNDDLRSYEFPDLIPPSKDKLRPTPEQNETAMMLVRSMSLMDGPEGEMLRPEDTANPTLQRWYQTMALLSLGAEGGGESHEMISKGLTLEEDELGKSMHERSLQETIFHEFNHVFPTEMAVKKAKRGDKKLDKTVV